MSVVHIAKARVYQDERPVRRAFVGGAKEPIKYGVNGGIASFYKMTPKEELPSTLDHIVGATAG